MDAAGTMKINEYKYDLWGKPTVRKETVNNSFLYSGEIWDSTTELQYLRARWYDPSMGWFINKDTYEGQIKNPLTLNLYTYVHNNPLIYSDPTGHFVMFLIPIVVPAIVGVVEIGGPIAAAYINEKYNKPTVVQQPKVEQKPVVSQQPVAQQKTTASQQPVAQQKPTVSQQPKVEQKVTVSQQPVVNSAPSVQAASPSEILRKNMIAAGIIVPSYPNAAHHIVAFKDERAATARAILAKFGIDINSESNGVFLPTVSGASNANYHPTLHTDAYYQNVEKELLRATNPAQAINILKSIGNRLQNGTYPR